MRFFLFLLMLSTSVSAKPLVVTTFSILGDMVHEVGQDKIEVRNLVSQNQDAHVYEPRPQDAKDLGRADLVVVNGLGFEGWLDRLIEASGFKGKILIATTGIAPLTNVVKEKEIIDPHAWHSLDNAQIYVDNIVQGLSDLSPQDALFFKAQGENYKKLLSTLKKQTQEKLEHIPLAKRKVITNHAAFEYLGREFNITFFSPLGISTDSEPSAKAVVNLVNRMRAEGIHAIFAENISNPRLLEQIARETNSHIGGTLYSDALSAPGTEADSYLKMMQFNLSAITKAMREQ